MADRQLRRPRRGSHLLQPGAALGPAVLPGVRLGFDAYADRYVEAGVTAAISMGPYAFPGHPLGPKVGRALAIVTAQSYAKVRPSGMKVFAETMIVESGLDVNRHDQLDPTEVDDSRYVCNGRESSPSSASAAPIEATDVVLATPPFWLAIASVVVISAHHA